MRLFLYLLKYSSRDPLLVVRIRVILSSVVSMPICLSSNFALFKALVSLVPFKVALAWSTPNAIFSILLDRVLSLKVLSRLDEIRFCRN